MFLCGHAFNVSTMFCLPCYATWLLAFRGNFTKQRNIWPVSLTPNQRRTLVWVFLWGILSERPGWFNSPIYFGRQRMEEGGGWKLNAPNIVILTENFLTEPLPTQHTGPRVTNPVRVREDRVQGITFALCDLGMIPIGFKSQGYQ